MELAQGLYVVCVLQIKICFKIVIANKLNSRYLSRTASNNLVTLPIVAGYGWRPQQFVVAGWHNILEVR